MVVNAFKIQGEKVQEDKGGERRGSKAMEEGSQRDMADLAHSGARSSYYKSHLVPPM